VDWLPRGRRERGHSGGIVDRYGEWIDAAAVWLEMGGDPMRLLGLEGVERIVAEVVLNRAVQRRRDENDIQFWNTAKATQIGVARAFGGR
jgi:hypothetical protein